MWVVHCKLNNDSRSWSILGSYENKAAAISHASRVSGECFMIKVTAPDGSVVWRKKDEFK